MPSEKSGSAIRRIDRDWVESSAKFLSASVLGSGLGIIVAIAIVLGLIALSGIGTVGFDARALEPFAKATLIGGVVYGSLAVTGYGVGKLIGVSPLRLGFVVPYLFGVGGAVFNLLYNGVEIAYTDSAMAVVLTAVVATVVILPVALGSTGAMWMMGGSNHV